VVGSALGATALTAVGCGALVALTLAVPAVARRPSVTLTRDVQPARVERGGVALGMVTVRNPGRRTERGLVASDRVGAGSAPVLLPPLAPGKRATATYRLPTDRRGALVVGPLTVARTDGLGLLARRDQVGAATTIWVQPRVVRLTLREAGRTTRVDATGAERSSSSSITFHALREYVAGDDLRHIHWRSTARTGTLMVRQHVEVSLPETTVILDTRLDRYRDADAFEEAVDAAASVAAASVAAVAPVTVITTGGLAVRARDGSELAGLLDRMAEIVALPAADGQGLLGAAGRHRRIGDALIAVTGRLDGDDSTALDDLRRRHGAAAVVTIGVGTTPIVPSATVGLDVSDADELARRWIPLGSR